MPRSLNQLEKLNQVTPFWFANREGHSHDLWRIQTHRRREGMEGNASARKQGFAIMQTGFKINHFKLNLNPKLIFVKTGGLSSLFEA